MSGAVSSPQRATLFVHSDGSSQPIETTVESEIRHGKTSEWEVLAKIRIEYKLYGNVIVHVEKEGARDLTVHVEA